MTYSGRPAKHIQRRMVVEALRRLDAIISLKKYRYVGFGGLEFLDFDLVHRTLGISQMTSIEHDSAKAKRFGFNRPFRGIRLLMGKASEFLPSVDWRGPRIVWLDYEVMLTGEVLRDAETVARVLRPGSVLIVTINAAAPIHERLKTLEANVGKERVPDGTKEDGLEGWSLARTQRVILAEAVQGVVDARADDVALEQIFNFHYRDGARMQTIGWLLSSKALEASVKEKCKFHELDYVRTGAQAMDLVLPDLTEREIAYLNRLLPVSSGGQLKELWLPQSEQDQYASIYRWYPGEAS